MGQSFDFSALHRRLDEIEYRIGKAREGLAASHPDFENDLATFIDRHDAIRGLIDEASDGGAGATAESATSALERGLESWLATVDKKYANPPPHNDNVSM